MLSSTRYGLVAQGAGYILAPLAAGQQSANVPLSSNIDINLPLTNNNGLMSWQIIINDNDSSAAGTFGVGITLDNNPSNVMQLIPSLDAVVSGGLFTSSGLPRLFMYNVPANANLIRFQWTGSASADTVNFIFNYEFQG